MGISSDIVEFNWTHFVVCSQGRGNIQIPVQAKQGIVPSMYTGHPTYAYPPGRDYATDRNYPGNDTYCEDGAKTERNFYPDGAPPLNMHQGGAHATGFV